ncbi:MAG: 2-amino-4-hydroxy-6-hydroxymethyldihydropteridine diphosphokinase [Candidatus Limnocylindrales bacterium]
MRVYIGLGANVGDAPRTLAGAVCALAALPGAHLVGVSRAYLTRPVGVADQPSFYNAAVALDVPRGPTAEVGATALLIALKGLERAFGRQHRRRWGPRELDLDLLIFGRHRIHVARVAAARSADPGRAGVQWLDVPHASAGERLFVLAPLADLAPGLVPPGWHRTIATARDERVAVEGADAARAVGTWEPAARRWVEAPVG